MGKSDAQCHCAARAVTVTKGGEHCQLARRQPQRALQQGGGDVLDQQLDEVTPVRLAETIGTSKTLSNQQLDEILGAFFSVL